MLTSLLLSVFTMKYLPRLLLLAVPVNMGPRDVKVAAREGVMLMVPGREFILSISAFSVGGCSFSLL